MEFKNTTTESYDHSSPSIVSAFVVLCAIICIILSMYIFSSTLRVAIFNYSEVPYTDQWTLMPFVRDVFEGKGTFTGLLAQQNEHRIAFMRLVFLVDQWKFNGLEFLPLTLNWMFIGATASMLSRAAWKADLGSIQLRLIVISAVICCAFSATQIEVITFPTGSMNLGVFFFALASLTVGARIDSSLNFRNLSRITLTLCLMFFCTCCSANGIVIWPLACLSLIWRKSRWNLVIFFSAVGMLAIAGYIYGYKTPPYHSDPFESAKRPIDLINYLLANFGAPFAVLGLQISSCAGLLLWVICIKNIRGAIVRMKTTEDEKTIFLFSFFLVTTCFLTALGRLKFGTAQAQASRYCTPILILWASTIVLSLISDSNVHQSKLSATSISKLLRPYSILFATLLLTFEMLVAGMQSTGDWIFETTSTLQRARVLLSLGVTHLPTAFTGGATDSSVKIGTELMKLRHSSFFRTTQEFHLGENIQSAFQVTASTLCTGAIDVSQPLQFDPNIQDIRGWAWSVAENKPPLNVLFTSDDVISGWATTGVARPDVEKAISSIDELGTGYAGYIRRSQDQKLHAYALSRTGHEVCLIH